MLYRSPFIVCNATNCTRYRAYGFDATSCELYNVTRNDTVQTTGGEFFSYLVAIEHYVTDTIS